MLPYGSAKDPDQHGRDGGHQRHGRPHGLLYAEDFEEEPGVGAIIDVRSAREFATGHLPGALNVPHVELRGRIDEVREAAAGRPVRVTCQVGVRSHIANRILAGHGFDTKSLSGRNAHGLRGTRTRLHGRWAEPEHRAPGGCQIACVKDGISSTSWDPRPIVGSPRPVGNRAGTILNATDIRTRSIVEYGNHRKTGRCGG